MMSYLGTEVSIIDPPTAPAPCERDAQYGRDQAQEKNVGNVGLVYNFYHARDWAHDDTKDFPRLWERIKPHVSVVGISEIRRELENLIPSQGDHELDMMRTIEHNGWRGPVQIMAGQFDRDPERACGIFSRGPSGWRPSSSAQDPEARVLFLSAPSSRYELLASIAVGRSGRRALDTQAHPFSVSEDLS